MKTLSIRNLEIGIGTPKICVPVLGHTEAEILSQVQSLADYPYDLAEWRADYFEGIFDFHRVKTVLSDFRSILGDKPLLFTFRTAGEGGEQSISDEDYRLLNCAVAQTGFVDLVDAELFSGDETVSSIVETAHHFHTYVIVSNHDFDKTPKKDEILSRLRQAQALDGDLLKIAVMPRSRRDVLTLLSATEEMASIYADRPLITMSMSGTGVISRLCGECFGSAITFASAGKTSAPGQIDISDLKFVLDLLHENI